MSELIPVLKNSGFIPFHAPNAEADDMAALYKESIFGLKQNVSAVYVSSDADWLQLVDFDKNTKQFLCVYNPLINNRSKTKFFCTQEFIDWMSDNNPMDMFTDYIGTKRTINEALSHNYRITPTIVEPIKILIDKIFCGDDGDNVPAFYEFYKNGKKVRVTPKRFEKISELCGGLNDMNSIFNSAKNGSLMDAIGKVLKTDTSAVDGSIRLERQRNFVELNPDLFPNKIKADFNKLFESAYENRYFATPTMKHPEFILQGSKFEEKKKTKTDNGARLNRIFSGFIDKPIQTINEIY